MKAIPRFALVMTQFWMVTLRIAFPVIRNYSLLHKMLSNYDPSIVSREISPNDTMMGDNYFDVGVGAVEVIISACIVSKLTEVKRVLDLPCGHGRVLRHLVALFPDAQIDACDLDKEGLDFCAANFNIRPILSRDELTEVEFNATYDLIWIGSFFTHTSYSVTKRWLTYLSGLLTPTGIIVSTFNGRWATQIQRRVPYVVVISSTHEHSAKVLKAPAKAVDAWYPQREDYL